MNLFNFSLKTVKSQPGKAIKLNVFSTDDMHIGELKIVLLENDIKKLEVYIKYLPYENAREKRIGKLKFINMKDYEETMEKINRTIEKNSKSFIQEHLAMKWVSELIVDGEIDFSDIFFFRNEFAIKVLGEDWFGIKISNNIEQYEELPLLLQAEIEINNEEKMRKCGEMLSILHELRN